VAKTVFEFNETVTLRQFRDLPTRCGEGQSESGGDSGLLVDTNMIRMDGFHLDLLGGIKLKFRRRCGAASEILNQLFPKCWMLKRGNFEQRSVRGANRSMSLHRVQKG